MPIPKVMEALDLWRQFPGELAFDLGRFQGRRIAEWHDGGMSSYELLELAEYLPTTGRFKTALHRADPLHPWLEWSLEEQTVFQIANELAVLRSAHASHVDSDDIGSEIFISPAKLRELVERQIEREEALENVYAMADRSSVEVTAK